VLILPSSVSNIGSEAFNCDLWLRPRLMLSGGVQVGALTDIFKTS
jgi:hypothetical protein